MKTLCSLLLGCALLAPARAARADSYAIPLSVGFNLIANQLDYGNNTLRDVLREYPVKGS